jgi:hypothetical protein
MDEERKPLVDADIVTVTGGSESSQVADTDTEDQDDAGDMDTDTDGTDDTDV